MTFLYIFSMTSGTVMIRFGFTSSKAFMIILGEGVLPSRVTSLYFPAFGNVVEWNQQSRKLDLGGQAMKEYKVIVAKSPEDAEKEMNHHALENWEVKAVTFWETAMSYRLVVTLERERTIV